MKNTHTGETSAKAAVGTEACNYQVYGHSRALLSPAQFLQHGTGHQVVPNGMQTETERLALGTLAPPPSQSSMSAVRRKSLGRLCEARDLTAAVSHRVLLEGA